MYMADDKKKEPLKVKQYATNSRWAKITLKAFDGEYWLIPFDAQIYINMLKTDGTLATATCTKVDEHTVLALITEQMTAVPGTQLGELYFLGVDGDIKSQTFPVAVYPMVIDQARIESSDDFQSLQEALRDVKVSTEAADNAVLLAKKLYLAFFIVGHNRVGRNVLAGDVLLQCHSDQFIRLKLLRDEIHCFLCSFSFSISLKTDFLYLSAKPFLS